jgi:hypothetical protein
MYSQCGKHVARRNAVDADTSMRPLDRETGREMADSSLGRVVRRLGLRNVHNRARHAAYHNDASGCLPLHEVLCNSNCVQICSINVDPPELLHAIMRIRNGIIILGEASRSDQVVDFAMGLQDFLQGLVDGCWARNVAKMCSDFRKPAYGSAAISMDM